MKKNENLKAFKIGKKQYYFKSYEVQAIYEFLTILLGIVIFYFYSLLFYAVVHNF